MTWVLGVPRLPRMHYVPFLTALHERLAPETYLEIGVAIGRSLQLSRCRSVGVDPLFHIQYPLDGDFALVRSTSDEFFSRPDPLALTSGRPFDLAFIDGLHILEFALRDFINAERHSSPHGLIVFDDVLPRTIDEAARDRHTGPWTGDVYPMLEILARYRPDLVVVPVDTQPTGLLLVFGLDPQSTALSDSFVEILAEFRRPDPQPVPEDVLDRLTVVPAQRVLEAQIPELLADLRGATPDEVRTRLVDVMESRLGRAFVPGSSSRAA